MKSAKKYYISTDKKSIKTFIKSLNEFFTHSENLFKVIP